jgi:hypothetical protein
MSNLYDFKLFGRRGGRDMLWNPTENLVEGPAYETRAGGVHMIYVFRNNDVEDEIFNIDMADPNRVGIPNIKFYNFEQNKPENRMPAYDNGKFIYEKMKNTHGYLTKYSASDKSDLPKLNDAMDVFRSGMYVLFPLLAYNQTLLKTDVTVKVRMDKPYRNRGAGSDYVSFGTPLVVGQEYYVFLWNRHQNMVRPMATLCQGKARKTVKIT